MSRTSGTGFVALCAGALVIALAPVLTRLSEVGPSATAFWRLALASPVLVGWRAWERRREPARPTSADVPWLLLAGACFAGDLAVWHWSIRWTTIAAATLFANLAPVFVTLGAWAFSGVRPTTSFVGALVLALSGVVVLVVQDLGGDLPTAVKGDVLGVLAAVFYAGYLLATHRVRARVSTATVMAWSTAASAVLLFVVTEVSRESLSIETVRGFMLLLTLGVVVHAGGQSLIGWGLAHVPAAMGSMALLLQPVGAAALASALLGEHLRMRQIFGGLLVLTGILMARRGTR